MSNNYNYYPQTNQQQYIPPQQQVTTPQYWRQPLTQTPGGLKGRPVSSIEEARASSIDFDGSVFYFPDLANKRIYTKQINMDGTASLNMYELKEIPVEKPVINDNYITREEFEAVINQLRNAIVPIAQQIIQAEEPNKTEIKSF